MTAVVFRRFDTSYDMGFIFSCWIRSIWWEDHPKTEQVDSAFWSTKTAEIKALLDNDKTHVNVACLKDDRNHLIGYAVVHNKCLQFVYVKLDYRKQGVASILCRGVNQIVKPMTKIGAAVAKRYDLEVKENNGTPD